jgi:hypothetical protein
MTWRAISARPYQPGRSKVLATAAVTIAPRQNRFPRVPRLAAAARGGSRGGGAAAAAAAAISIAARAVGQRHGRRRVDIARRYCSPRQGGCHSTKKRRFKMRLITWRAISAIAPPAWRRRPHGRGRASPLVYSCHYSARRTPDGAATQSGPTPLHQPGPHGRARWAAAPAPRAVHSFLTVCNIVPVLVPIHTRHLTVCSYCSSVPSSLSRRVLLHGLTLSPSTASVVNSKVFEVVYICLVVKSFPLLQHLRGTV